MNMQVKEWDEQVGVLERKVERGNRQVGGWGGVLAVAF